MARPVLEERKGREGLKRPPWSTLQGQMWVSVWGLAALVCSRYAVGTKNERMRRQVMLAMTMARMSQVSERWAVRTALGQGSEHGGIVPPGDCPTGTQGAQMIILEEIQDQGGGEEATTTEKHDLSQQVPPPDLPSASLPLLAFKMGGVAALGGLHFVQQPHQASLISLRIRARWKARQELSFIRK